MLSAALSWPFCSQRTDNMAPPKNTHRRASDAEDIIAERLRSGVPPSDPNLEAGLKIAGGLGRMVDMRIPLWQVLVAVGGVSFTLIGMWFTVQQLNTSMQKVQATLEASTVQTSAFREELGVQKFRLAVIEADIAALKAARYRTTP